MAFSTSRQASHVVVVDPVASRRMMVSDVLRALGFQTVDLLKNGSELTAFLDKSTPDWIICGPLEGDVPNCLQILNALVTTQRFRSTRLSLVLGEEAEEFVLASAFELGLLSYHSCNNVRERLEQSLANLVARLDLNAWDATLVSAEYLREFLQARRQDKPLLDVLSTLVDMYPGSGRLLLQLAETQSDLGDNAAAHLTLSQTLLVAPRLEQQVRELKQRVASEVIETAVAGVPAKNTNLLGIETCVVIDPDSAVLHGVTQLLKESGVPSVVTFVDGEAASHWLSSNPEPGLILMEWRLPRLSGPLLIQRVRQMGHIGVPVIVASSLVTDGDDSILKEMGAAAVLPKPFDQETFFSTVVAAMQQHKTPTEFRSYETKIRTSLANGNMSEARRLFEHCLVDDRITDADRSSLEADLTFAEGDFERARDLALESLRSQGDRLYVLNLLGKCFLKLGRPDLGLRCFDRAQELSPLNVRRLCEIATVHAELGDLAKADEQLDKARVLDPSNPVVKDTACQVALGSQDDARISAALADVDSIGRLLVYLNNRAVALAKVGRFHDGINLFRRTVRALPEPWADKHDIVTYNLGLALARYGEHGEAICQLRLVQGVAGPRIKRKADSLAKRIEEADANGTTLVFRTSEPAPSDIGSRPVQEESHSLEIRRGDICCHRIFRAMELADARALALLQGSVAIVTSAAATQKEDKQCSAVA